MLFISEFYLVFCFFIFFFYGIFNYYSFNNNFIFRFNGANYLLIQIMFNTLLIINNTFIDNLFLFNDTFYKDSNITELEIILLIIFCIFLITTYNSFFKINYFEYYLMLYICVLSTFFLLYSTHLVLFFIFFEIQSISIYILSIFNKHYKKSIESTFKYFIIGSISSFLLLLFISIFYSFTGLFSFFDIYFFFKLESLYIEFNSLYLILFIILCISLFIKLYIAPFHFWVSDIYESSIVISTYFFSTFYFLSISFIFIKFYMCMFFFFFFFFKYFYMFFSIISIIYGNLGALNEINVKRLIAYSSVSSAGYFLCFFFVNDFIFFNLGLNFIICYIFNLIPIFIFLVNTKLNNNTIDTIFDLFFIYKNNFFLGLAISILFFSLGGLPINIFFLYKLYLFLSFTNELFFVLFIFLFFNSIVGIFYYIKLIKDLFFFSGIINLKKSFFINFINLKSFFLFYIMFLFNLYIIFFPTYFIYISNFFI